MKEGLPGEKMRGVVEVLSKDEAIAFLKRRQPFYPNAEEEFETIKKALLDGSVTVGTIKTDELKVLYVLLLGSEDDPSVSGLSGNASTSRLLH